MMTKRELVREQIQHRETTPVPYTCGVEQPVAEQLNEHFGGGAWRERIDDAIRSVAGPDWAACQRPTENGYVDEFGSLWRTDRRPTHLERPALEEPDLDRLTIPSVDALFHDDWFEQAAKRCEELEGYFTVAGIGWGLFERSWTIRGFENALLDSIASPDFYKELVDTIAAHQRAVLQKLLSLPVDGIMFSDDWGDQRGVILGPERWRRFIKPRVAEFYEMVHGAGKYTLSHCCGSVTDIMEDIIDIGLDVLESVQPEAMDPYMLKERFGDRIAFWGGLGSQSTIPFGTPDEIRAEVRRLRNVMGQGGGYILAPAKALQPGTPIQNAIAVIEAITEGP